MDEKSKATRGKHPDIPFLPCWMRPRSCVLLPSLVSMGVHIYPMQSIPFLSGLPFNAWFIWNEYGGRNWWGATIWHSLTGCSKTRLHKVRLRAMEYLEPTGPGTSCALLLCPEEALLDGQPGYLSSFWDKIDKLSSPDIGAIIHGFKVFIFFRK